MSEAHEGCLKAVRDALVRLKEVWPTNRTAGSCFGEAIATLDRSIASSASPVPEASGMPTKFHKMRCLCEPCNEDAAAIRAERDAAIRRAEKAEAAVETFRGNAEFALSSLSQCDASAAGARCALRNALAFTDPPGTQEKP